MNGRVDEFGRALVVLNVRATNEAESTACAAWIDTGFNGELVMPKSFIEAVGLEQTAAIEATLADGKATVLEAFTCIVEWFGRDLAVEVIANDGEFPLLGIGLLVGRKLVVDYRELTVTIE